MNHPRVFVLGYSEASMLLRNPGDIRIDAIIAIAGQREHAVSVGEVSHSLMLEFDDTEAPKPNDLLDAARQSIRRRDAASVGLRLSPPTAEHALLIIEFARTIRAMDGALLCHCLGGISRSSAAALLCLAEWTGPGNELACVKQLLAVRPSAQPHRDLVSFGDKILGRDGGLLSALDAFRP